MLTEDTYITLPDEPNAKITEVFDRFIKGEEMQVESMDKNRIQPGEVCNTRTADSRDFISIHFDSSKSLVLTPDHRVYLPVEKKYIRADELSTGMEVLSSNNKPNKITSTHNIRDNRSSRVYALAIAPVQNYFANDVLVHNEG